MRPSLVVFAALLGGVNAAQSQSPAPFADSITITATAAPEKRSEVTATVDVIAGLDGRGLSVRQGLAERQVELLHADGRDVVIILVSGAVVVDDAKPGR